MITELTEGEIEELLRRALVGRIGCHAGEMTYVVPIIYAWDGGSAYVQSIEGRKIEMMRQNPRVCFEVDEYDPDGSWRSVIAQGEYEELEGGRAEQALSLLVSRFAQRRAANGDGARPRALGRKPVAFRIRCHEITGRKVARSRDAKAVTRLAIVAARLARMRGRGAGTHGPPELLVHLDGDLDQVDARAVLGR